MHLLPATPLYAGQIMPSRSDRLAPQNTRKIPTHQIEGNTSAYLYTRKRTSHDFASFSRNARMEAGGPRRTFATTQPTT